MAIHPALGPPRVILSNIYVDDGISGAEFAKRPGLVRLINTLNPRPPFQVLVMSEESRLGREQIETAYLLTSLPRRDGLTGPSWSRPRGSA
jgi:DNA invertase Pin-like site-specific DNA recombinase